MSISNVIYESAKQRMIVADYQSTITEQQISSFTQDIQRLATRDESGNGHIMVSDLYSVLCRSPPEVRECFRSQVINKLSLYSGTSTGCISCQLLTDFLVTCCRRSQQFLLLQSAARSPEYITSNEFLDLVMAEISNKLSWESGMKDCPFYYAVFVERCVFFQFDPQRTGKVSMLELISTRVLDDLFEVLMRQKREPETADKTWDTASSWFSMARFWRVLEQFRICDKDCSGMVSLEECRAFRDGTITPLFWERVFANQMLYGDQPPHELDFRGFVDVVAAITSRSQPASIRWLFRILDLRDDGVLDRDEIKMMVQSMLDNLSAMENWAMNFNADDIVDEIVDMINPAVPNRIVVDDVISCSMAETALGILIDYVAFLKYENREEEATT
ncbi:EF-hand domain-containing protein [Trichostrongylus colubriformis]|uniref:EF-hand domain-containing protein n=1 Tax=Trichostrongylus colubriformis TaxID=6319 RepID=A0AAN8J3H4_TRICO